MGFEKYLAEELERADDLAAVQRAVVREQAVRQIMAETGEPREIVIEQVDALASMDQEAVLELTDGNPTTMADALARYVRLLPQAVTGMTGEVSDQIASDLAAILEYPWRDEEALLALHEKHGGTTLHIEEGENRDLEIRMGPNRWLVATVNWEDAGSGGQLAAEQVARAVHRATLARVLADRDHHVQLNPREREDLIKFLERPNGSWIGSGRLSVDAVSGGGVLVRTRPYAYQRPGHALAEDQKIKDDLTRPGSWCGNGVPPTDPADVPVLGAQLAQEGRTDV